MTTIYDRGRRTAARLLEKHSQGNVVIVVPGEEAPGEEPWDPPLQGAPTEVAINATVSGIDLRLVDNDLVLERDKIVTFTALPNITPEAGWIIKINGVDHVIVDPGGNPSGDPVVYNARVRT